MTLPLTLLRSILENPADDNLRLIAADWLDEHGYSERANFIRLQCTKGDLYYNLQYRMDKHGWRSLFGIGNVLDPLIQQYQEREGNFPGYSWGSSPSPTGPGLYKCGAEEVWIQFTNLFKLTARRGFVASISLTTEAFLGERCKHCSGTGRPPVPHVLPGSQTGWRKQPGICGPCTGTGYLGTGGHAKPLFEAAPIEEVWLSDREPAGHDGLASRWYRDNTAAVTAAAILPPILFDEIVKSGSGFKHYRSLLQFEGAGSHNAARTTLARAAVAYGRSLVRLREQP